jgi:hypothetical protein
MIRITRRAFHWGETRSLEFPVGSLHTVVEWDPVGYRAGVFVKNSQGYLVFISDEYFECIES